MKKCLVEAENEAKKMDEQNEWSQVLSLRPLLLHNNTEIIVQKFEAALQSRLK